jgi:hypothetical protein
MNTVAEGEMRIDLAGDVELPFNRPPSWDAAASSESGSSAGCACSAAISARQECADPRMVLAESGIVEQCPRLLVRVISQAGNPSHMITRCAGRRARSRR